MNEQIKFRFAAIQIISKTLEPRPEKIEGIFNFDIKAEIKVGESHNLVMPHIYVKIKDADNPNPLASFIIAFLFEVIEFSTLIKINENGLYDIPKELEDTIRPVSISTARGIIYSELRGTYLQNAIMPVVYMKDLKIEGDMQDVIRT